MADAPVPEAPSSRRAGAADLDVVFGLLATRWEEFRGRSREDRDGWLRRLGEGGVEAWLVFEHGAPVAVAALRPDPTRDVCRRFGVQVTWDYLVVDPGCRGGGRGRWLAALLERQCASRGWPVGHLTSNSTTTTRVGSGERWDGRRVRTRRRAGGSCR